MQQHAVVGIKPWPTLSVELVLPKSCIRIIIGKIDTLRGSGSN